MKYKIEKKRGYDIRYEWYYVYRRHYFFFWKKLGFEATLEKAKEMIYRDKREQELRKEKPEVVGYYK